MVWWRTYPRKLKKAWTWTWWWASWKTLKRFAGWNYFCLFHSSSMMFQFLAWFDDVDSQILTEQEKCYRYVSPIYFVTAAFLLCILMEKSFLWQKTASALNIWFSRAYSKQLCEYREQCGGMLEEVGKALEFLQEMKERHQQVSHKTGALHQACEQLVEEQVRYTLQRKHVIVSIIS